MTDIAIRVNNLSKMYRIGRAKQRHDTLRDLMVDTFPAYPTPISADLIGRQIADGSHIFRYIENADGDLVASASAEIDHERKCAEMTDCHVQTVLSPQRLTATFPKGPPNKRPAPSPPAPAPVPRRASPLDGRPGAATMALVLQSGGAEWRA